MRYSLPLLVFSLSTTTVLGQHIFTADHFPDRVLRSYLYETYGPLTADEAAQQVTTIEVTGPDDLEDMTGLGFLTGLQHLKISGMRQLTALPDLSPLTALEELRVIDCHLRTLRLADLPALETVDLTLNPLGSLSLEDLPRLESLNLRDNLSLRELNVARLDKLTSLRYDQGGLRAVTLTELPELTHLWLPDNKLSTVPDIAQMPALQTLDLSGNTPMTGTAVFADHQRLRNLDLTGTGIQSLELRGLDAFVDGDLGGMEALDHLILTDLVRLSRLVFPSGDRPASLILMDLPALRGLEVDGRFLRDPVELSEAPNLELLRLRDCGLSELPDLSVLESLETLDLGRNPLTHVNLPAGLVALYLDDTGRTALPDLSGLTGLGTLSVAENQLTELDLTHDSLTHLDISGNHITSLRLVCPNLVELRAARNRITHLGDLPASLDALDVAHNRLTELDVVADLAGLSSLDASHNRLQDVAALAANPSLGSQGEIWDRPAYPLPWVLIYPGDRVILNDNLLAADDCDALAILEARTDDAGATLTKEHQAPGFFDCAYPLGSGTLIPHLTAMDGGFTTRLLVQNRGTVDREVMLHGYDASGDPMGMWPVPVAAGHTETIEPVDLFPTASHLSIGAPSDCVVRAGYVDARELGGRAWITDQSGFWRTVDLIPGEPDWVFDGVALVNTSPDPARIEVDSLDVAGTLIATTVLATDLAPAAKLRANLSELVVADQAARLRIRSDVWISPTLLRGGGDESYQVLYPVSPLPEIEEGLRIIPHLTREGNGFTTRISLINPSEVDGALTLRFFDEAGEPLEPIEREVPAGATLMLEALPFGAAYAIIEGSLECVAVAAYRAADEQGGSAHLSETQATARDYEIQPGDGELLFDGLACVNTGEQAARIELTAVDRQGRVSGLSVLTESLAPGAKLLAAIHNLLPLEEGDALRITSDQPLAATFLRGTFGPTTWLYEVSPLILPAL